ncbi:MAG: hypothetical protein KKA42_10375 [candidate division Zixibacteria bacterium]|nr:hypothetical protein [candidate division Zixibacteria bacterium]
MKRLLPIVLFVALLLAAVPGIQAGVVAEAIAGGGYQENLFNDSSSIGDKYASFGTNVKYYPSSSVQLAGAAQYNAYATYGDLSNLAAEASATVIPTPASSALTLALRGRLALRKFGAGYQLYDQLGSTAGANLSYRLTSRLHLQSSTSYGWSSYTNADYGSSRNIDASAGIHATLPGANAVAVRFDFARQTFDQPKSTEEGNGHVHLADEKNAETFDVTGLLVRFSRPLSARTGINLSYGQRQLHVDNDLTVLSYTIDYLSPWADLWEGISLSGTIKHFFPGQWITEFSAAYFDKDFVDVAEPDDDTGDTYWQDSRRDKLTALSLTVSKPVTMSNSRTITPSLSLGYRNNQSSSAFFNYEDVRGSFSVKFTL